MRRDETDPARLLGNLLDRHERAIGPGATGIGRRITAFPATVFSSPGEREALSGGLRAAGEVGAIHLEWDREAPHLVRRVVLMDAARLYHHLGRRTAGDLVADAMSTLDGIEPATDPGRAIIPISPNVSRT